MEVLWAIETELARLEADTKAAEASAQKDIDTFMIDSKVDEAQKSSKMEHKTAKKQSQSQALTAKTEDLEGTGIGCCSCILRPTEAIREIVGHVIFQLGLEM